MRNGLHNKAIEDLDFMEKWWRNLKGELGLYD